MQGQDEMESKRKMDKPSTHPQIYRSREEQRRTRILQIFLPLETSTGSCVAPSFYLATHRERSGPWPDNIITIHSMRRVISEKLLVDRRKFCGVEETKKRVHDRKL